MDTKAQAQQESNWIDSIRGLDGKRVVVEHEQRHDWRKTSGTERGLLRIVDNRAVLFKQRNSRRGRFLTRGMYDGFYATLTVKNIKPV